MMIPVSAIAHKMINFYGASLHDINHFLKVHAFAKLIGESEGLDRAAMDVLECAAILHDIACPLCREKYGSARGDLQEKEGMPMTQNFLAEFQLAEDFVERMVWLVGHHHSPASCDTVEHRILLEADYLVNAHEGGHSKDTIEKNFSELFRTVTGKALLKSIYGIK